MSSGLEQLLLASGCLTIKQEKQKDPPSDLLFFFCALEDLVQKPVALRLF